MLKNPPKKTSLNKRTFPSVFVSIYIDQIGKNKQNEISKKSTLGVSEINLLRTDLAVKGTGFQRALEAPSSWTNVNSNIRKWGKRQRAYAKFVAKLEMRRQEAPQSVSQAMSQNRGWKEDRNFIQHPIFLFAMHQSIVLAWIQNTFLLPERNCVQSPYPRHDGIDEEFKLIKMFRSLSTRLLITVMPSISAWKFSSSTYISCDQFTSETRNETHQSKSSYQLYCISEEANPV